MTAPFTAAGNADGEITLTVNGVDCGWIDREAVDALIAVLETAAAESDRLNAAEARDQMNQQEADYRAVRGY